MFTNCSTNVRPNQSKIQPKLKKMESHLGGRHLGKIRSFAKNYSLQGFCLQKNIHLKVFSRPIWWRIQRLSCPTLGGARQSRIWWFSSHFKLGFCLFELGILQTPCEKRSRSVVARISSKIALLHLSNLPRKKEYRNIRKPGSVIFLSNWL